MKLRNTLIFGLALATIVLVTVTTKGNTSENLEEWPVAQHYEGGQTKMLADIKKEVVYPLMARRSRKQGQAIVTIMLHADGTHSQHRAVTNLGLGMEKEAVRVVKTLKFNGPGFDQKYNVPVKFSLK